MPRRPLGSGDEWVMLPDGRRFWGAFGAAGLLAHAPDAGVLLQHRAGYSHFGGTWGLPGGARHSDESAVEGAIREAAEEAGVPSNRLRVQFTSVLDLDVWTYTTVVAAVEERFEPVIGDAESIALAWVPIDEVDDLPLHPGFASAWPELRAQLRAEPTLIIDAANVDRFTTRWLVEGPTRRGEAARRLPRAPGGTGNPRRPPRAARAHLVAAYRAGARGRGEAGRDPVPECARGRIGGRRVLSSRPGDRAGAHGRRLADP